MTYHVKEIFYSLQGEGAQAGRAAVFCRFAGCNLWSGREVDRVSADCQFCDTDFVGIDGIGGGRFAGAGELADSIVCYWTSVSGAPLMIFAGGEPLLQLDDGLIKALHQRRFGIAVETNGTLPIPAGVDWLTVSPKAGAPLVARFGSELKLVFPQSGLDPADLLDLDFRHRFLQPMDGADVVRNTNAVVQYCLAHPPWRLSLQTHKVLGIR